MNPDKIKLSLAKKYLSNKVRQKLKYKKTPSGFSLADALKSDVQNPDSTVGLYAGDAESYDILYDIFQPVISDYHALKKNKPHESNLENCAFPNPDPKQNYIISTRIRVARNLSGFPFPTFINNQDRLSVENKITSLLGKLPEEFKGIYVPLKIIDEKKEHQFYLNALSKLPEKLKDEKSFSDILSTIRFKKGDRFQEAAGLNRSWPDARGVYFSHDGRFVLWLNEEDHLRIISMEKTGDISKTFNRLTRILNFLSAHLIFAYHRQYGYLTSCPSNVGTGMRAGVHIRLPKLFKNQKQLFKTVESLNLQVRGTQGEKTNVESGVFDISNRHRLGVTEKQCIEILYNGICRIIELEKAL